VPDLERGKVPEDWWYFPVVARLHGERTGYPTQKPVALLKRIILASSNPGDIVADFFCGSGTTPFVASKFGRNFVACDETFRAIHTTRSRLIEGKKVFSVEHDASSQLAFHVSPKNTHFGLTKDIVTMKTKLDVDYWEVDSDWDGKMFRSSAQANRPVRTGEVPSSIKIITRGNICIRFVTTQGKRYQLNI
jgi:adenine specific DNA methylase Mod